jgi:GAF domain-containing protein
LASALSPQSDLHEGLHRLTLAAAAALELDGTGITVQIPGDGTHYLTAADPLTLEVERRQDELQEGACVDAIQSSQVVAVNDLNVEQPWPRFTWVLLEAGFHAAAGVPIRHQGQSIGAINLYSGASRAWTTEEFNAARLISELAAGYLITNQLLRTQRTLAEQLQTALDSRVILEQAKGVLAERYGMAPDTAFEIMRSYSRAERLRLRDTARAVIEDGLDVLAPETARDDGSSASAT